MNLEQLWSETPRPAKVIVDIVARHAGDMDIYKWTGMMPEGFETQIQMAISAVEEMAYGDGASEDAPLTMLHVLSLRDLTPNEVEGWRDQTWPWDFHRHSIPPEGWTIEQVL